VFCPGVHDEHIIDRNTGDGVNTLRFQRVCIADKAGQVLHVAGWRERTWHGKNYNLAAIEQLS
jgi:hypothetical protein